MEVEIRAKLRNPEETKQRLLSLGGTLVKSKELTDIYYGDLGLYEKIGHSFWIRIRIEGDKVTLAYKGPTETDGVYEEYEQELQDLETSKKFFERMGLDNPVTITKKRDTYNLGDISILFDDFGDKGTYVELEQISESHDKTEMEALLAKLEVPQEDIFHKGFITKFLQEDSSPYSKWIVN
jgi:predicted adenylyl cyclase CyaB